MATSKRPRAVEDGDRSPSLDPDGIEAFVVGGATDGARLSMLAAVRDVLQHAERDELASVSQWLQAILAHPQFRLRRARPGHDLSLIHI